ncbi:MAG: sugar phosphate isomerase/epimerase family protein [Nitrospinota bacterium]
MDLSRLHLRISYSQLDTFLPIARKEGTGVEGFVSSYYLDRQPLENLEPLVRYIATGKGLSWHAPFMDLSPGGLDEAVRKITFDRIKQAVDLAAPLSPKAIVVHTGYDQKTFNGVGDKWLLNSIESWKNLLKACPGVHFAAENVFDQSPYLLLTLIEGVGSERFGHCFDAGHFNVFSKVSLQEWFNRLGPFLKEVHLHDNTGHGDQHLGIGCGSFDFNRLFTLLRDRQPEPVYTVESHTAEGVYDSLRFLEKTDL